MMHGARFGKSQRVEGLRNPDELSFAYIATQEDWELKGRTRRWFLSRS